MLQYFPLGCAKDNGLHFHFQCRASAIAGKEEHCLVITGLGKSLVHNQAVDLMLASQGGGLKKKQNSRILGGVLSWSLQLFRQENRMALVNKERSRTL